MGLFKMKQENHPIVGWVWACHEEVFKECPLDIIEETFIMDLAVQIPISVRKQFGEYFDDYRWYEGVRYDINGYELTKLNCYVFTCDGGKRSDFPNEDDPGELLCVYVDTTYCRIKISIIACRI